SPLAESVGGSPSGGRRIIALGIHPASGPPPDDMAGNRLGTFAATPEGKTGAPGTPNIEAAGHSTGLGGHGSSSSGGIGAGATAQHGISNGFFVGRAPAGTTLSPLSGNSSGSSLGGGSSGAAVGTPSHATPSDERPLRETASPRHLITPTSNPTPLE